MGRLYSMMRLESVQSLPELKQLVLKALSGHLAGMTQTQLSRELDIPFNDLGLRFALNELVESKEIERREHFGYSPRYALLPRPSIGGSQ